MCLIGGEKAMEWIIWVTIGVIAANMVLFGGMALIDLFERRRKK